MSQDDLLILLPQLLWSSAWWCEELLIFNILQFWSWPSSFEIPMSPEISPDAIPTSELSDNQSYHCENKFHQYDLPIHLHFGSVATVQTNVAVLVSFHPPASLCFPPVSGLSSWEEDANFLELLKSWGPSFKSVSWSTHSIPCIVLRSRIAARHDSGTRKSTGLTGNVGWSRAARCLRIVKNSLVSDKEFTLFCKYWIWVNNWLTVVEFLSWRKDNSSFLACLARSASSQQILLNASISWQYFAWFSRKSLFQISNSPYNFISSPFEPVQPVDSPVVAVIVGTRTPDWCHKEQYPNFSFPNVWPPCQPQLRIILAEPVFLLSRPIQLSVQGFCGDSGSYCLHNVLVSISPPLTQTRKDSQWTEFEHSRNSACCRMLAAAWCSGMSK